PSRRAWCDLRDQTTELLPRRPEQPGDGSRLRGPRQAAQGFDEWRVRDRPHPGWETVTPQNGGAGKAGAVGHRGHEPGLADPGFAADHQRSAAPAGDHPEHVVELGELLISPDDRPSLDA